MSTVYVTEVTLAGVVTKPAYQRPLDDKRIGKMAREWNPHETGVPELVLREDGVHYAVDGQHRLGTANVLGIESMWCRVHEGLDYAEEVALYRALNNKRKKLEPIDDFHALVEGQNPDALALKSLVESAGYRIARGGSPHHVRAVTQLWEMYRLHQALIPDALEMLSGAVARLGNRDSLAGALLGGVHYFLVLHPDVNRRRLVRRLAAFDQTHFTKRAEVNTNSKRRAAQVCVLIEVEFNRGLREDNRIPLLALGGV